MVTRSGRRVPTQQTRNAGATRRANSETATAARAATAFVGREPEVTTVLDALGAPPALVLIEGEAGIGKTRLVHEALDTLPGKTVLKIACPPLRDPFPLGGVVDCLRQLGDDAGVGLSPLGGALRPLFPEWADRLPPALERLEDPRQTRHRIFAALSELVDRLGVDVLLVEDAHWADTATVEWLLTLTTAEPAAEHRRSVVVTYRPEEIPDDSLLRQLTSYLPAGVTRARLTLEPLTEAATARLISSMLDDEPISAEFATFLHDRTDGVPLAVEESVRLLHQRDDLIRRDGEWVRRSLDELRIPPTVRDSVLERVQWLSGTAQRALRAAAMFSGPVSEADVVKVAELSDDDARGGLADAVASGLLVSTAYGGLAYRHALMGRAVYEAVPEPERRRLHRLAGRALEGTRPVPVEQLARHFREAGEVTLWSRYAEQAAELAAASGDHATTAAVLHDLLTNADLPAQVVARLTKKMPFAALAGPARYRNLVRSLKSVLNSGGLEPGEGADVRLQLGRVLLHMEEYEEGRAELERAIPGLAHDPSEAANAMTILGYPRGMGPASMHRRWLHRAAEVTSSLAAADRLSVVVGRACALLMLGEEEGWVEAARIPDDGATAQERQQITIAHLNIGDIATMWGRYAEAGQRLAKALELAERYHHTRVRDVILATRAHLDWFTGAWDGLAERVHSLAEYNDMQPVTRLEPVLVIGLLHVAGGAHAQADRLLQRVLAGTREHGALEYLGEPAAALARMRLAEARVDDALLVTDEPIRLVAQKHIWIWATDLAPARVEALVAAGRFEEAARLVSAFARGLRGRDAPAPRAALATCRAILVGAKGEHARAATAFARAAGAWGKLPRPYDALLTRERQAGCLLAAGRSEPALSLLSETFQNLVDLGARGDAARVMHTLRSHGVDVKPPWRGGRRGYGNQLSPRELEVVRLVVAGQSNREIAEAVYRSPRTIGAQLSSAMRKLGVSSRTAVAVAAMEAGLLDDDQVSPEMT